VKISGYGFKAYKVAEAEVNGTDITYTLTEDFRDSGVELSLDKKASELAADIRALEKQLNNAVKAAGSAESKDGVASFGTLETGLYLIVQTKKASGYTDLSSFLVSIPTLVSEDGNTYLKYDVETYCKPNLEEESPQTTSITVRKIWQDDDDRAGIRPDRIKAQLYRNGKAYGAVVTISEDNNWMFTWNDLPIFDEAGASYEYTVKEVDVPDGYVCTEDGTIENMYTLTNTISETPPPTPTPTPDEGEPKLPKKPGQPDEPEEGTPKLPNKPKVPDTSDQIHLVQQSAVFSVSSIIFLIILIFGRKLEDQLSEE